MKRKQLLTKTKRRKSLSALILIVFFTVIQAAAQTAAFQDGWQTKNIANPVSIPMNQTTSATTVTINVDASQKLSKVSKYVFGHNAGVWGGKINNNAPLMTTIKELSPNIIRWPGGNMSNDYFWNATSQATCPSDIPPALGNGEAATPSKFKFSDMFYGANNNLWTMSLNDYYDMLAKTNSKGIICVNYAYARYGTSNDPVAVAAKYAADWVRYDNGRTKYWEIGNENYGSWETGYEIDTKLNKDGQPRFITGDLYGRHCKVFIDAMQAAAREIGSEIKIGVVTLEAANTNNQIYKTWNSGLMPHIANKADYLIPHNYFGPWKQNSNADVILNSVEEVGNIKQHIMSDLLTYGGKASLPLAMTEWNINAEGSGQQTSYINGIHGALMLGEFIKNGYGQASRWDFLNGFNNGDSHGLIADGETDITKYSPRAPFYYMYYFQKFFGDNLIKSDVLGSTDVKCYASLFSSGQSGVVAINKGATTQTISIQMKNFSIGSKYHYYILTGGQETQFSRKVFINGKGPLSGKSGGPDAYTSIQSYSTAIENGSIKITLPKYSVVYMVVENGPTVVKTPEINVLQASTTIGSGTGNYNFLTPVLIGGSSLPITFTIQNTGTSNLNVGAISLQGLNPMQFVVSQVSTPTIIPGATTSFTLTFKPTLLGDKSAIISIVNNDSNENPYTFNVTAKTAIKDCAGVLNGSAKIDACGICTGGTTGKVTLDTDRDGSADCVDTDDDNDGVSDVNDCAPINALIKGKTTWYADADGDGKGDATVSLIACAQPLGYVASAGDACPTDPLKIAVGNCGCNKAESSCLDCAGVSNGTAKLDACGICAGGTTGKTPIVDAALCGTGTIGIKGPACVEVGKNYTYSLTTDNIPVSSISWWSSDGATMTESVNNEKLVTITIPSYASGSTTINAGVNFTASPWYKPYSLQVKVGGCATSAQLSLKAEASPLPFYETTTISLENETMIDKVVVMDLNGIEVVNSNKINTTTFELGRELPAGLYVAYIYSAYGVTMKRIMKLN